MLSNLIVTTSIIVMCRILTDLRKYGARGGEEGYGRGNKGLIVVNSSSHGTDLNTGEEVYMDVVRIV